MKDRQRPSVPAWLDEAAAGLRLLRGLPTFLQRSITVDEARATLSDRLLRREARLIALANRALYGTRKNPCRHLLDSAGCEAGDFARLVMQEGVDGALLALFRKGVYLTLDEFKGRHEVVRGSVRFTVEPGRFANPDSARQFASSTSGSRGRATPVVRDLAYIRDVSVDRCLAMAARGGLGWTQAHWGSPGITLAHVLEFASFGMRPSRWFSFMDMENKALPLRYRTSVKLVPWAGRVIGVPLPEPEYVPIGDPLPLARWLGNALRHGQIPHLSTFPSPAVRLCQAAADAGIDLQGLQLTVDGEPLTPARLDVLRRAGAIAVPRYAIVEFGSVGLGCLAPEASDDNHLIDDLIAAIQPGPEHVGPFPSRALLFTSLSATAPLVVLNVSMGDEAVLGQRRCGCTMQELGWRTHLHGIRSFEKLTVAGVTLQDTEIVQILDEVLPTRFGGLPTDYQLVEETSEPGHPRLRLLIHPRVGTVDEAGVADAFLGAVGASGGSGSVFAMLLREADALAIERRAPLATPAGKILHLHGSSTGPAAVGR